MEIVRWPARPSRSCETQQSRFYYIITRSSRDGPTRSGHFTPVLTLSSSYSEAALLLQVSLYKVFWYYGGKAPCSNSNFMTLSCPRNEATWNGVLPNLSFSSIFAP
jgi:hypothetical protein